MVACTQHMGSAFLAGYARTDTVEPKTAEFGRKRRRPQTVFLELLAELAMGWIGGPTSQVAMMSVRLAMSAGSPGDNERSSGHPAPPPLHP